MRSRMPPVVTALLLAWCAGVAVVWLALGWQLEGAPWGGAVLAAWPWRGALAAAGGLVTMALAAALGLGVGRRLGWWRPGPWGTAEWALAMLVGFVVWGIVGGLMGLLVVGPLVLVMLVVLVAALLGRGAWPPRWRGGAPSVAWWIAGAALAMAGLAALAPAVQSDGLRYHLAAPQEWLRAGRMVVIPYSANSNMPALQGLLAATLGDFELGRRFQLLSWAGYAGLLLAGGGAGGAMARWMGAPRGAGAAAAVALLASIPAMAILAAWPFSDVLAVALVVGAVWAALPGGPVMAGRRLPAVALLLGGALATKISLLPIAGLVAMWALTLQPRRRALGQLPLCLALGLLVLMPWLAKSLLHHGNPVYPLAWGLLGGPEWSAANEEFYRAKLLEKGVPRTAGYLLATPWLAMRYWASFEGFNAGPMVLMGLPLAVAAVAVCRRRVALGLVGVAALGWVVWFHTYQSTRFLLPVLALLAVGGGALVAAAAARAGGPWPRAARIVLAAVALAGAAWAPAYHLTRTHIYRVALGAVDDAVFITRELNSYPAIQWLASETSRNEPVLYIGEHRIAYSRHFLPIASDWFDTPRILVELRATKNNEELAARWRDRGVRFVLLNRSLLQAYRDDYFRPRFSEEEWQRFLALEGWLLERAVYTDELGVVVARIG